MIPVGTDLLCLPWIPHADITPWVTNSSARHNPTNQVDRFSCCVYPRLESTKIHLWLRKGFPAVKKKLLCKHQPKNSLRKSFRKKIPPAEAARDKVLFKDDAVTLAVGGHHFGVLSDQSGVSGKTGVSDRSVRQMVKHLTEEAVLGVRPN